MKNRSIYKFQNAKLIYSNDGIRFIENKNLYYLEPNRINIKYLILINILLYVISKS